MTSISISGRTIGPNSPTLVIAEIGINHNGDVELAKRMMKAAREAGCDAVKFQKRSPRHCVPQDQWEVIRETPWGRMSYIDYKERIEFNEDQFQDLADLAAELGILWFASPWDEPSVTILNNLDVCCHKVASASVTDYHLLDAINKSGRPVIMSTGMSTIEEVRNAVERLKDVPLALLHSVSIYPTRSEDLNLRMINTLREEFNCVVGYSGHETGLPATLASVALGASIVERHFTLDRSMWGTDQAASVEPEGMRRLVRGIRTVEKALGDGVKRVLPEEANNARKLRRA